MGGIHTDLVVSNANTEHSPQTIRNALVDTGATHTVLPTATLPSPKPSEHKESTDADIDIWIEEPDSHLRQ